MELRSLGRTGLKVSALGLGTMTWGEQNTEAEAHTQLDAALDAGINLIDTAPAYGTSEERLGPLLRGQRQHWVIVSKVGEEFSNGASHFDFTPQHARLSLERSLRRLQTDVIDL